MKQLENYNNVQEAVTVFKGEASDKKKTGIILSDANQFEGLANPSLVLWASLGLSAEHSYLLIPLS